MCLQAQVIDDDDGGLSGGIRDQGLSDNNGGVGGGRGIYDASELLETTAEAAGARQRVQGIYNNDGGFGRRR